MTKISSKWTWVTKRIFPLMWFGFLGFFLLSGFLSGAGASDPMFYVIPGIMAVIGFVMMKKLVWDLVDEVFDYGDGLLIKNRGNEERLPLANIMNVNVSTNVNPPRITLRLDKPGRFGKEIAFSPASPFTINPFAKNPIGEDLIERVDRARAKRAV